MSTATAEAAKPETQKPDAIARATSPETIREELAKVEGQPLSPQRGALQLASQGVVLNNLEDAWRFAGIIASTGLAPRDMNTPAKILLAMQMGMEVGLPPMASIQNIAVINGRPSLWGDVCLGLCRQSGLFDEAAYKLEWECDDEGNATKAICTVRRLPNGQPIVSEFTWKEAQQAGLAGKDAYKNYRKRMLMNRARAFALRDGFADVLKGVLTREEANDLPPRDLTPQGPVAATSSPTNLDELTEQLHASAAVVAQEAPVQEEGPETKAAAVGAEAGVADRVFEDLLRGLGETLAECKYVTDVTKQRNLILANNTLTNEQRKDVEELCEARATEIKNAKRGGKADEQRTLV